MIHIYLPCSKLKKHFHASLLKTLCLLAIIVSYSLPGFAQPAITSFSPSGGPIGSSVTITGTNFGNGINDNIVYFGPVQAIITAASATSITATVPVGAGYQPITVTTNYLTGSSSLPFTVTTTSGTDSIYANSFQTKQDLVTGPSPNSSVVADFDGDGKTDVIVANISSYLSVFRNTSTPFNISFQSTTLSTSANMRRVVAADINGDGKLDFVMVKHQTTSNALIVYKNTSTPGNISFVTQTLGYPGLTPITVAITDFNGDGKPDIVGINDETSTFSVIKNIGENGTIAFAAAQNFTLLNSAKNIRIITGKFDTDNRPDIVLLTSLGVSTFTNTSTSTTIQFGPEVVYPTTTGASNRGIATADVNNDGILDLAVVYLNSAKKARLGILRGYQTSNDFAFNAIEETVIPNEPTDLTIEDLNLDGKPDLAVADKVNNTVSVFRNNFTGTTVSFDSPDQFGTGITPTSIVTGDFDGDGQPDMAVTHKDQAVLSIIRNTIQNATITAISPNTGGPGTEVTITGFNFANITGVSFGNTPAASYTVMSPTTIKAIAGEGSDGLIKVTSTQTESTFNGFTFVKPLITSFSPVSGPVGSTVTITGSNFSAVPANNIVYFGAVQATITAATTTSLSVTVPAGVTWQPISVTAYKATAYSSTPFILAFGGDAAFDSTSFSGRLDLNTQVSSEGAAIGDFNNDGKPDLATIEAASGKVSVFTNNSNSGNLAFSIKTELTAGNKPYDIATGDFNSDGKLDLVVGNTSPTGGQGTVSIFINTTIGSLISFAPQLQVAAGTDATRLAVADFDGDKRPDIAFANTFTTTVGILRNISNLAGVSFVAVTGPTLLGKRALDIVAADLDTDGKAELIVTDYYGLQAAVYKNTSTTGTISFATAYPLALEGYSFACAAGDLDGDNLPDLVISKLKQNARFAFSVFKNTSTPGNIAFTLAGEHALDYEAYGMAITDMNGDGKPDVLAANGTYNSRVSVFRNTSVSNITLAAPAHYATGTEPVRMLACDMNGDAKPDLLTSNRLSNIYTSSGGIYILLNLIPLSSTPDPDRTASPTLAILSSPNPFTSSITVRVDKPLKNAKFLLANMNGKILRTQEYQTLPAGSSVNLFQSGLTPGFYYLMVESAQGRTVIKLLKQ